VKVVQKEKESLESAKEEAEVYLQKEKELVYSKLVGYQLLLRNTEELIRNTEERKAEVQAKLDEEKEKWSGMSDEIKASEKECKQKLKEQKALKVELDKVNNDFKEFERKDIKLREDHKFLKQKQKKLQDKVKKAEQKIEKMQSESKRMTKEIPKLEANIETAEKRLSYEKQKMDKILDEHKDELSGHRQKLEKVNLELAPWEKQKKEVEAEIEVAEAERKLIEQKEEGAQKRVEETEQTMQTAAATSKDKKQEVEALKKDLKAKERDLKVALENSQSLESEYEKFGAQMQSSRGRVEERKAALHSEQNQNQVVKALMNAQKSGKLRGIHGRLGDLGAVDAKYDVAVSTACPGLSHIVVETVADAQSCVQYLKSLELGRATFLILEKQRALQQRMVSSLQVAPPQNSQRLIDLIKMKNPTEHKVAFYFALRDTVVAQTLEQAQKIAYGQKQRWRVVTLPGQVIEMSGTMSGGGKPKKGRILVGSASKLNSNGEDLGRLAKEAEQDFVEVSRSFEMIKEKRQSTKKIISEAGKVIDRLRVDIPKAEMEIEAALQQATESEKILKDLKDKVSLTPSDKKRMDDLKRTIATASGTLDKLNKDTKNLQEQAQELEGAIDNIGGEPLKRMRKEVTEVQSGIEEMHSEISKMQVQIASNEKLIAKGEKDIVKAKEDADGMKDKVQGAKDEMTEIEEEALVVMENCKRTQDLVDKKAEEIKGIEQAKKKLQKAQQAMKTAEVDIEHEMDQLKSEQKQNQQEKKHILKQIENTQKTAATTFGDGDLHTPTEEELNEMDLDEIQNQAVALEQAMADMKVDLNAVAEYKTKEEDYNNRVAELDASTATRDGVRNRYDDLRKKRLDEFMAGFNTIALKLKEMYQMITLGGDAELELVDSLDPFIEGIVFSVRPPKKSWKNIRNLSGGEKTLSSLALVFALHHYKPTPLYVMDEIDAALDFRNVSIVAHYIKERTKNAQFVIISLRNNMFELADRLVGIYKTHNTTKSVTIDPEKFLVGQGAVSVP
jgi:structural maintenance of chromosome 4